MSARDKTGTLIAIGDQVAIPAGTQTSVVSVVSHLNVMLTTGETLRGRSVERTGTTEQPATATGYGYIDPQDCGTTVGTYTAE